jgi:soluble lytic murein transglycosylase
MIVKRFPASAHYDDAYLKLGQSLEKNNQRWEALAVYREILEQYPQIKHYMKIRFSIKELTGKYPEDLFAFSLRTNRQRVSILLDNKKYSRALFILNNQMLPESSNVKKGEIYSLIGICKFHLRLYDNAIDMLKKAIELGRGETVLTAHYYLTRIYYRKDDESKFFRHSNVLLGSGTRLDFMDKVLYNLGSFYEKKKDFTKAIGYWRKLADEYPSSTLCDDALWHLAWNTYCQRQYSKALEAMENMEETNPGSEYLPRILFWKGKIFEKLNRYQEAYRSYHKTAHFFPYTYYGTMAQKTCDSLLTRYPDISDKTGPFEYFENPKRTLDPELMNPGKHRSVIHAVHYEKGMELLVLGFKPEAITEFDAYETETELDLAMKFQIAELYMVSGDYYRGIRTLTKIVRDERIFGHKIVPDQFISKFFPSRYRELIRKYSTEHGLDPYLVAGMILQESAFNHRAISSAGARGLMQLMPGTAKWLMRITGIGYKSANGLTVLYDPELNIALGTRYIKMLLKSFPDKEYLAIASYNAGKGNVEKWMKNLKDYPRDEFIEMIPFSETQGFVKHVLRNRQRFKNKKIFEN